MKQKSGARILIAAGNGGMAPVEDHRFTVAKWTIEQQIPRDQADSWMQYLQDECSRRKWGFSSFGQMEAEENSGSATIHTGPPGKSGEIVIVWERTRTGPLKLRVSAGGTPPLPDQDFKSFFARVNERHQLAAKEAFYRRGFLHFRGLPWRGEFWLGDGIRLSPPTRHASYLLAPQVIVVDAVVSAIGQHGSISEFAKRLNEIALFMTFAMRTHVHVENFSQAWTLSEDTTPEPQVRQLGYWETMNPSEMPQAGVFPAIPLRQVNRLNRLAYGISADQSEQFLANDVPELWTRFAELPSERRSQFLNAANAYQVALSVAPTHPTAAMAFRVVACEALKPLGKRYDDLNVYDVVEELLGASYGAGLRGMRFAPQRIRSAHVHRGELLESEAARRLMMLSTFHDPTCDQEYEAAAMVLYATMVEWLRRGGALSTPLPKKQKKAAGRTITRGRLPG